MKTQAGDLDVDLVFRKGPAAPKQGHDDRDAGDVDIPSASEDPDSAVEEDTACVGVRVHVPNVRGPSDGEGDSP